MLDETMNEIGHFSYRRIDRRIEDSAKELLIARLKSQPPADIDGRQVTSTNFSDGFKFIFENGDWLLIRPSGTEPVLRLYSEAGSPEKVDRLLCDQFVGRGIGSRFQICRKSRYAGGPTDKKVDDFSIFCDINRLFHHGFSRRAGYLKGD